MTPHLRHYHQILNRFATSPFRNALLVRYWKNVLQPPGVISLQAGRTSVADGPRVYRCQEINVQSTSGLRFVSSLFPSYHQTYRKQDGTPPIPFQVVLPLFPQFTLHELEVPLSRFNPDGLPIEVYMPTTCEWEVIIDPQWPITMITGMKQILLSLRPDYTKQFQDKPRLNELLGRQPRKGPMSKRAAAGDLVSPRKPKLLRSMPPSMRVTPMAALSTSHDDHETWVDDPPCQGRPQPA